MMTENEYLPFKTINVFVDNEFLQRTVSDVLKNLPELSKEEQISFNTLFREYVNVLGFRNPMRAPMSLRINAYVKAFQEKEEVVPFTLSTWTKINGDLAEKVKAWLKSEGWENLRLERRFGEDEGFIQDWPSALTFDKLVNDFRKSHPNLDYDENDIILMVLWISGKLPEEETGL